MTRLRHSTGAFARMMQMSRNQIFIFVEGWSDRNLYDRIARTRCEPGGILHDVRTAVELPNAAGGKEALVAFFVYLRRRSLLLSRLQGKATAVLFFVDKDLDDILRRRRRSTHMVYSEFYDIENSVFRHGDLIVAGAAAASLDEASVRSGLPVAAAWRRGVVAAWADWLLLCYLARRHGASCSVTYRRPSPINPTPYAGADAAAATKHRGDLQVACGLSAAAFQEKIAAADRLLDELLRSDMADRIFKGKWYKYFLAFDLRRIAAGRPINSNGLEDRVVEMLKMTVDVNGRWAARYHDALDGMLAVI